MIWNRYIFMKECGGSPRFSQIVKLKVYKGKQLEFYYPKLV